MVIRVSIIPNSPNFLKNQLFSMESLSGSHCGNNHWMQPFVDLRHQAAKEHVLLETWDLLPPDKADIVVIMELPSSPEVVKALRRESPHLKVIFMPIESPLGRKYTFSQINHEQFDAILTYNHLLADDMRYFHYFLPVANPSCSMRGEEFSERKPVCMICSFAGLRWRTGFNVARSGWRFSFSDWWEYAFCPGELISARISLARSFNRLAKGALDIYGDGWQRTIFSSAMGRLESSKLGLLGKYRFNICYENCENDCGYISEKLFDALYGDTVPVYLGNRSIHDHIPKECFVDAREFGNHKELIHFICNCPEKAWEEYRRAGKSFLESQALRKFLPPAFADNFLRPVRVLANQSKRIVTESESVPL